jgi:uncharacterized protein YecE (DUF72 family)
MARFLVGTSGWSYPGWRGSFYPEDLPARDFLSFYSRKFNTTEVNYSFYHLPRVTTYQKWSAQTPEDFVFALKASRLITHIQRLRNASEEWGQFVERALALKEKLGPILLQLPQSFHATAENLQDVERFLSYGVPCRAQLRLAMEFRHESCFGEKMIAILRRHNVSLVIAHSSRYPVPEVVATAPFVYFRFHGPKELFASGYSESELRHWAARIKALLVSDLDVYAYFNNDACADAVPNAETLAKMVKLGLGGR